MKNIILFALVFSLSQPIFACKLDQLMIKRETSLNLKFKEGKLKSLLEQDQTLSLPFRYEGKSACVDRKGKLKSTVVRSSNELKNEFVVGLPESKFKKAKGNDFHYAILDHQSNSSVIEVVSVTCVENQVLFADSISFDLMNLDRTRPVLLDNIGISMFIATGGAAQNLSQLFSLPRNFSNLVSNTAVVQQDEFQTLSQPAVITGSQISLPGQKYNVFSSSMIAQKLCNPEMLKVLSPYLVGNKNPTFEQSYFEISLKNNILLIK